MKMTMKNNKIRMLTAAALMAATQIATAGVIASLDLAPSYTDMRASFQANTLLANDYVENGLLFKYSGIGSNAGCGFEGVNCYDAPEELSPAFSGNYMATSGNNAYISVRRADGEDFYGIQFAAGSGYANLHGYWQAYKDSVLTGAGNFSVPSPDAGTVLSLHDWQGFDEVRYFAFSSANRTSGFSAAAIDEVMVDVPEPASLLLVGVGLLTLAGLRRRESQR